MGLAGSALLALVAAADPSSIRTSVDVGVASEARSRSVEATGQAPVLTSELEVMPALRLELASRTAAVSFAYGPRVVADGLQQPRVVHEGRTNLDWRPTRTWTVRAVGTAAYGTEPRPGSNIRSDPSFAIEVSPIDVVDYARWDAGATVESRPAPRWRLELGAGYRASGGLGASAASMPHEEGPRARATARWNATRRDEVGAVLDASATSVSGAPDTQLASIEAAWRRNVARDVDAELAAGTGAARSSDGVLSDARPTGRAALAIRWPGAVARAEAAGAFESTIIVDRYSGTVQNRYEVRASGGWAGEGGWRFDARLVGALQADVVDVLSRVGALELRAGYRLSRVATATTGVRFTWQRSVVATVSSFTEWSAFLGVAFTDRRVLGEHPPTTEPEGR